MSNSDAKTYFANNFNKVDIYYYWVIEKSDKIFTILAVKWSKM